VRGNNALAARIARLEARRPKRSPIQPLMKVYDLDDEIIAIAGTTGALCHREAGEPTQAFLARSRAALMGEGWLTAQYLEDASEAMPAPKLPVPEPKPTPQRDLAGIGSVGPGWRTPPTAEW
jgi:hypothetical protein